MTQTKPPFDDILARVRRIAKDLAPSVDITDDMPLFYEAGKSNHAAHIGSGGAGLDSLDRVEFAMLVEDQFDIRVPDEIGDNWLTVAAIARDIDAMIAKRAATDA